jgi:hypothetical protein
VKFSVEMTASEDEDKDGSDRSDDEDSNVPAEVLGNMTELDRSTDTTLPAKQLC